MAGPAEDAGVIRLGPYHATAVQPMDEVAPGDFDFRKLGHAGVRHNTVRGPYAFLTCCRAHICAKQLPERGVPVG